MENSQMRKDRPNGNTRQNRRVVVIGGGVGGLAAAIRLAAHGFDVTLFEAEDELGGKVKERVIDDLPFDLGPTVLTMPWVLRELYQAAGADDSELPILDRVEPTCRYFWPDGSTFDAWSDEERRRGELERVAPLDVDAFEKILRDGQAVMSASEDLFLRSPFTLREIVRPGNLRLLRDLSRFGIGRSLHESVSRRLRSDKLIQLFDRFATYNGSSPYRTPATFLIIPWVEIGEGAWYPRGGMRRIINGLERLADRVGVQLNSGEPVERIKVSDGRVSGVIVSGRLVQADVVVSNADAMHTERMLDSSPGVSATRTDPSLSGVLILVPERISGNDLRDHNVFFSSDYRREFRELFEDRSLASEPTIYLSTARSRGTTRDAGAYLLINAPAYLNMSRENLDRYAEKSIQRLEAYGIEFSDRGRSRRVISPADFARLHRTPGGELYGTSSNSTVGAFFRPRTKPGRPRGLYQCGGTVHPGGGVPLVILSGSIAATQIIQDYGHTS